MRPLGAAVSSALVIAGICAVVFCGALTFYLVATIFMVGGDGTAPAVTHLTVALIEFTVRLLGFSRQGNVLIVAMFWAGAIFLIVFTIMLPVKLREMRTRQDWAGRNQPYAALVFLLALAAIPLTIYGSRKNERAVIEEERLALEFVTHNRQLIELAGGPVRTFMATSTAYADDRNRGRYDFPIMSPKAFYAIVDVDRSSGKPVFRLACVTTLSMGNRQVGKDDCAQSAIPLPK